jgi:dUTP pyrophosphatase
MEVKFKKLFPDVKLPIFATPGSAAADVCSYEDITLEPGDRSIVHTGLSCAVPEGYALLVCSRSGMALAGIIVANQPGIVDSDYRGELGVIMWNTSQVARVIAKGDRIAQLLLTPVVQFTTTEVNDLGKTERTGGFGSTGKA